jgi:hypothetical protein
VFVFGGRIKATKELNNDLLIGQLDANQKAVSWSRMYVSHGNNMSLPERAPHPIALHDQYTLHTHTGLGKVYYLLPYLVSILFFLLVLGNLLRSWLQLRVRRLRP